MRAFLHQATVAGLWVTVGGSVAILAAVGAVLVGLLWLASVAIGVPIVLIAGSGGALIERVSRERPTGAAVSTQKRGAGQGDTGRENRCVRARAHRGVKPWVC